MDREYIALSVAVTDGWSMVNWGFQSGSQHSLSRNHNLSALKTSFLGIFTSVRLELFLEVKWAKIIGDVSFQEWRFVSVCILLISHLQPTTNMSHNRKRAVNFSLYSYNLLHLGLIFENSKFKNWFQGPLC